MDDKPESQAEALNYSEIHARTVRALEGGSPARPKRKRGYHRALRRGEMWAVVEESSRRMFNEAWSAMYADPNARDGTVWTIVHMSEFLRIQQSGDEHGT